MLEYSQQIRFYCSHDGGVIYFTQNILELKYSVGKKKCGQACCTLEFSKPMIEEIIVNLELPWQLLSHSQLRDGERENVLQLGINTMFSQSQFCLVYAKWSLAVTCYR